MPSTTPPVWTGYRQLRHHVDAAVARAVEGATGLSLADLEVLVAVRDETAECVRVSPLAESMRWSRSRLSRQLGRMERRGLVERVACDRDGRGDDIELTPEGLRLLARAEPEVAEAVDRYVVERLTARQLSALGAIVDRLLEPFDPPEDGPRGG